MTDRDVRDVLTYYFADAALVRQIEPLGGAGGWSGSRLWRITASAGAGGNVLSGAHFPDAASAQPQQLCLRQFPPDSAPETRLRFAHRVQQHVVGRGLHFVPLPQMTTQGSTLVAHQGTFWELVTWMPGRADFHDQPTPVRLCSAMRALARFHIESAMEVRVGPAPAVAQRLDTCEAVARPYLPLPGTSPAEAGDAFAFLRQQLGRVQVDSALEHRCRKLLDILPDRIAVLRGPLSAAALVPMPLQPAIRDVHHDHVLFTGDDVTGLIDFGALRIDTPLTDVARLVGSLVGDDRQARQFALDAYAELRPLTASDRQLIDLLDESGTVLAAWNWLLWLYGEQRDMGPPGPIVRRLQQILTRLESPCLSRNVWQ